MCPKLLYFSKCEFVIKDWEVSRDQSNKNIDQIFEDDSVGNKNPQTADDY
jgi:hypothetical protein